MLPAGTQVKALPFGAQETLTPEEELEFDPYEGPTTPVTGILEIIQVPADYDFNAPSYTLFLVDNTSVDPETIESYELTAAATQFSNQCHSPETGEFCKTPGAPGHEGHFSEEVANYLHDQYQMDIPTAQRLGLVQDGTKILIPFRNEKGEVTGHKWRDTAVKTGPGRWGPAESQGLSVYENETKSGPIFVVESPSEGLILSSLGHRVVFFDGADSLVSRTGEVNSPLHARLTNILKGQDSILVPDNDIRGEAFAKTVEPLVSKRINPPEGDKDLREYLIEGGTVDALQRHKLTNFYLTYLKAKTEEFFNKNHDEKGRFAPKEGSAGGPKATPAEVRKWARDNNIKVGERGRIHPDLQAQYNKAHKAAPVAKTQTTKGAGDFKARFDEVSKGVTESLTSLVTYGKYEGGRRSISTVAAYAPEIDSVEQRVNKVGSLLHDEITSRLEKQGILTDADYQSKQDALGRERRKSLYVMDDLRNSEATKKDPGSLSTLEQFKRLYPGRPYKSITPQELDRIQTVIDNAHPGYKDAAKKLISIDTEIESTTKASDNDYALAYRTTALQVLSEAKGGKYGNLSFDKVLGAPERGTTSKAVIDSVKRAGHVFPDDWVADSNQGYVFTMAKQRGLHQFKPNVVSYDTLHKGPDGRPTKSFHQDSWVTTSQDPSANLAVDKSQYFPTSVHEMGHRFEELRPHIKVMESSFFARRTKGEKDQQLRKLQPNNRYQTDEYAKPDKFENAYMGKTYGGGRTDPYELFTMGIQGMFGGSRLVHIHKDKDYASFILGILATG